MGKQLFIYNRLHKYRNKFISKEVGDTIKNKNIYKYLIIIGIFFLIYFIIQGGISLFLSSTEAKYTNKNNYIHYIETESFYLISSKLNEENKINVLNYYNFEPITIDISNGLNNEISTTGINYEIKCTITGTNSTNYTCKIDDSSNILETTLPTLKKCYNGSTPTEYNEETCKNNNLIWTNNINTNNHTITIISNNNIENDKIILDIELNTTSKYNKHLSSRYILNTGEKDKETINKEVINSNSNICILKLDNLYEENKNINIEINTNKYLFDYIEINKGTYIPSTYDSNNNIKSINTNINSNTSIELTIFKNNKEDTCTKEEFNITIN